MVLEVIILDPYDKHKYGHHEESDELDEEPAEAFDEEDGEPVSRKSPEQGDDEHGPGGFEDFPESTDFDIFVYEVHGWVDVLLG